MLSGIIRSCVRRRRSFYKEIASITAPRTFFEGDVINKSKDLGFSLSVTSALA